MGKLFQNIGKLEERILPQINTNIPPVYQGETTVDLNIVPTINQGQTTLKVQPPSKSSVIDQLKFIGNTQEKNAALLKITPRQTIGIDTIPVRYSFVLKPNANIQQQSPILINFTNQISLADRLKQSNLGTTQHLPQFFLSDVYANYIRVVPFVQTTTKEGITVSAFVFTPSQGGINPVLFSTRPISGGVTPILPIQNIETLQGIVISNNVATSYINLSAFNPTIVQGSTNASPFLFVPSQGETTVIAFNPVIVQGATTVGSFNFLPIQGATTVGVFNYIPQQGAITVGPYLFTPIQGETDPTPVGPTPSQGERLPQIVAYEIDKLAAIATPLLKHGTSLIDITTWQSLVVNQGVRGNQNLVNSIDTRIATYTEDKNNIGFGPEGGYQELPTPNPISTLNIDIPEGSTEQSVLPLLTNLPPNNSTNPLNKYATIGYGGIARRAARPKSNEITDFRQDVTQDFPKPFNDGQNYTNSNVYKRLGLGDYGKGGVDRSDFSKDLGLNDSLYQDVNKTGNDLVKLKFNSVRDGQVLQFRSYIKGFSEDYNIDYTDIEYVGRPDKLKLFKGNSRGGTLNFVVPAGTKQELRVMHQKINRLAQLVYGAKYVSEGDFYFLAPFMKLTVGDYYRDMPINITSLKYDTNPTEYPWEINIGPDGKVGDLFEGPQFIDVSVTYNVIGHFLPLANYNVIDTPGFNPSTGQNIPT